MKDSLSPLEAQKLVLLSQQVYPDKQVGIATAATLATVEHLGYIQIDTLSVIERAHHHTLWNRNPRYQPGHLDQLISEQKVFEYWSHAAAYLPMRDYRFSLPRKRAFASGEQAHWDARDEGLIKLVLKRISAEGPLMAKDFDSDGKQVGAWKAKPAKKALEYLFMQGDLMIAKRVNFHKVYDLTERVLPEGTDIVPPAAEEHARFLILQFLRANGLGQLAEMGYLLKGVKPQLALTLAEMIADGEVVQVEAMGQSYAALPASLELLGKPLPRRKVKILSPFDNLVIQRKRMKEFFDFDYLIECYLPATQRKYGYFSLPILWGGKLAGRMDCKVERKEKRLLIHHLALEGWVRDPDLFGEDLGRELRGFLKFCGCHSGEVQRTTPAKLRAELRKQIAKMVP